MGDSGRQWAIFTSHGLVLLRLAAQHEATLRQVADTLGLTERHVARVVKDLRAAGLVAVRRQGRRNAYAVDRAARLPHPTLAEVPLGRLLDAVVPSRGARARGAARAAAPVQARRSSRTT
jgi:DNA-binding transcriptional ArsR family regulator